MDGWSLHGPRPQIWSNCSPVLMKKAINQSQDSDESCFVLMVCDITISSRWNYTILLTLTCYFLCIKLTIVNKLHIRFQAELFVPNEFVLPKGCLNLKHMYSFKSCCFHTLSFCSDNIQYFVQIYSLVWVWIKNVLW